MRAIVEVSVSYEQDTERAIDALGRIAREWAAEHREILLDPEPEVHAIQALGESAITMRIAVRVLPGEEWQAKRDLRRLIKQRFDEQSIEIPYPRRTVYVRHEPGTRVDPAPPTTGA
jgi:small conductance mechanosensitive channel